MILSAVKDSYTDLFEYTVLGNSHKQLTDDIYDDLEPKYFPSSDEIIFSSNRHHKSHVTNNLDKDFDLFKLNTSNKKIVSLTNSNDIDERQPQPVEKKNYHYISDENGIFNHYQTIIDSTISHIDTMIHYRYTSSSQQLSNFNRNIIEIDFSLNLDQYVLLYRLNNEYDFYLGDKNKSIIFENTFSETYFKNIASKKNDFNKTMQNNIENDKIDIYNYKFEDEKKLLSKKIVSRKENEKKSNVKFPRQKIYNINFTLGEFIMQLNPTFNNQAYQRYSSSGFKNAGFDGFTLIQAKMFLKIIK
jgi:hypothetical protein